MSLFIGHPKETELALFAGGELGPLARWRIERHLQDCGGCQEIVADFFHLQTDVRELAEIPAVNWNALAQDITARVRQETPAAEDPAPGWFGMPRTWQVGLATAAVICTIAVVRQFPINGITGGDAQQGAPLVAESQPLDLGDTAVSALQTEPDAEASAEARGESKSAAPRQFSADEPVEPERLARATNEALRTPPSLERVSEERARRDEDFRPREVSEPPLVADIEAQQPPVVEPAAIANLQSGQDVAVRPGALSFAAPAEGQAAAEKATANSAGTVGDVRASLEAAPAPPARSAAQEADSATLQDQIGPAGAGVGARAGAAYRQPVGGDRRQSERAELAQARPAAPVAALGEVAPARRKAEAEALAPERGFTVLPAVLDDPRVDVGVAADGWMSIRAVDSSTGTITITDVYVP